MTVFIRLLRHADKEERLSDSIAALRGTSISGDIFRIDPQRFVAVPTAPFAYSLIDCVEDLFRRLPPTQSRGVAVAEGLNSTDNNRFVRLWCEADPNDVASGAWVPLAKGGEYARYHSDLHLLINWSRNGAELRALVAARYGSASKRIYGQDYYFRPGLTYSQRSQRGLSFRVLPAGAIFNVKGPAVIPDREQALELLAILNSTCYRALVDLQTAFGSYNVGYVQRTPLPELDGPTRARLRELARGIWSLRCRSDTSSELSHTFVQPALMHVCDATLEERARRLLRITDERDGRVATADAETDDLVFTAYGIEAADRARFSEALTSESASAGGEAPTSRDFKNGDAEYDSEDSRENAVDAVALVVDLISYAIGVAFGRFDVRFATGELEAPELPDPFAPLPACSPGMLTGEDGMPLEAEPEGYPLRISWDGVLVDDHGLAGGGAHADDIVSRVRELLALLWGDHAEEIEHEACGVLGAKSLRDYFGKPSGFFAEHLKRYSKSRRQAPIYWPLSTASGSYTLWLYYPRLDEDLLYTAVIRYLEPKMGAVGRRLDKLDAVLPMASGREATELRTEREELASLQADLADLRAELLRVAALPYKPDLDDGALICAAPLAKLFRLGKWRKDLEACWKKLEHGDYDWAHLAYAVWPERVLEACRRDRSIAIAHGVEEAFEG